MLNREEAHYPIIYYTVHFLDRFTGVRQTQHTGSYLTTVSRGDAITLRDKIEAVAALWGSGLMATDRQRAYVMYDESPLYAALDSNHIVVEAIYEDDGTLLYSEVDSPPLPG